MNLLQIDVCANITSTGKIAESIGLLSQKNGFNSFIAWGREYRESQSHLIHIGNRLNNIEHGLETRLFDNHGLASRLATKRFLKKVKDIKPDIVQLHCIHGYYINYAYLFECLKELRVPVVWTFHDCWAFTGHCPHFAFWGCDKWKTGCYSCPQKKIYPSSWFLDRSKDNYKIKKNFFTSIPNMTIVSVSNWIDRFVSQSFLKDYRCLVIKNGIDTGIFSPCPNNNFIRERLGIKEDETMILGVANPWTTKKGLDDFFNLNKHLNKNCKIVLVGLNRQQIENLPPNIIGIERTDSAKDLSMYYSAADLFLNLTYEDNYPTTNLEAISSGTPCLTYDTGGSSESITPETGFVVPQGDLKTVQHCIRTIQETGKKTYTAACRKYALAHFRAEDCFQDYINLYKQILHL